MSDHYSDIDADFMVVDFGNLFLQKCLPVMNLAYWYLQQVYKIEKICLVYNVKRASLKSFKCDENGESNLTAQNRFIFH